MKLLKIGDRIVNIDLVTDIHLHQNDSVLLRFAMAGKDGRPHEILCQDETGTLKQWLLAQVADKVEGRADGAWQRWTVRPQ